MKRLLWLLLLVSISYAQFFEGTNSDIPVPVESKNPAFHVSTFGGFKLVDSYYTRDQYDEILPPYGFALGFSTKRIFVNLGYAKNRDFEITFHHMFFKQGVLTALWGVNGLLVPDIESEATSYVPEDSTSKFFRIPLFAEVYLKPHKWFSGGIGFGFGKFGVRNRFEDPLQTPGIFATAAFTPIKQLKIFWEGYTQTYRRNWGVVISPNDYLEVFGILRYGQYPPGDDIKFNQLFVGVRVNIPVEKVMARKATELTEQEALQSLEECRTQLAQLNKEISKLENLKDSLRAESQKLDEEISALEVENGELKAEIAKYPSEYTVEPGDCLYKIAGKRYIYNNPRAWPRIYRANRDLIKDPNLIYPGWVLKIPHGIVKEIEVMPGDCLWKLAGLPWVYNNPLMWPKLYEANKDQIKDPDLIYPGQRLRVER